MSLDITFGLNVVDSSSPVSVLFREAFSHPYISFFHLVFSVIIMYDIKLANKLMRILIADEYTVTKLQLQLNLSVQLSENSQNFFKLTSVSSGPSIAILIGWGKETESLFCCLFRNTFHSITLEELYFHVLHELERIKLFSQADPFVKLL